MEVLRPSQVVVDTDSSQACHTENQLASLPVTPSHLALTCPADTSATDECTQSVSTTLSATNTSVNHSTVATSILKVPSFFRVQTYYHCPLDMQFETKVYDLWINQIRDRLNGILLQKIPTGTCMQELMMVGTNLNTLRPTIIVSCGDSKIKKEVERVFKTLSWLQAMLKANKMAFLTINTKIRLSGSQQQIPSNFEMHSEAFSIHIFEPAVTLCGQKIVVGSAESQTGARCTFGGVILIDGIPHGMSAAHPFRDYLRQSHLPIGSTLCNEMAQNHDDDSGLGSEDEPFYFNGDDDVAESDENDENELEMHITSSTLSINSPENGKSVHDSIEHPTSVNLPQHDVFSGSCSCVVSSGFILSSILTSNGGSANPISATSTDWAVLKLSDLSMVRPNKISYRDSRHDIDICDFFQGTANGEGSILAGGTGVRVGQLHGSSASLNADGVCYNVQMISLEETLRKFLMFPSQLNANLYRVALGSSGSWVVMDNMLCGFVIATRMDVPWAYMMPIGPVLEDMKRSLGTNNIKLPDNWTPSAEPKVSKALHDSPMQLRAETEREGQPTQTVVVQDPCSDVTFDHNGTSPLLGDDQGVSDIAPNKTDNKTTLRGPSSPTAVPSAPAIGHGNSQSSTMSYPGEQSDIHPGYSTTGYDSVGTLEMGLPLRENFDLDQHESLKKESIWSGLGRISSLLLTIRTKPFKKRQNNLKIASLPLNRTHKLGTVDNVSMDNLLKSAPLKKKSDERSRGWRMPFESYILRTAYRQKKGRHPKDRYRSRQLIREPGWLRRPRELNLYTQPDNPLLAVALMFVNLFLIVSHYLLLMLIGVLRVQWHVTRVVFGALPSISYYLCCGICHIWVVNKHQNVLDDRETHYRRLEESIEMLGDDYHG